MAGGGGAAEDDEAPPCPLNFFFFLPKSSYSSESESWCLYSTWPRSSKPPPIPVRSSTSPTLGPLQMLQVDLDEISKEMLFLMDFWYMFDK